MTRAAKTLSGIAVGVAVGFGILFFGELIPKTLKYGQQYPFSFLGFWYDVQTSIKSSVSAPAVAYFGWRGLLSRQLKRSGFVPG